MKKTFVITAVAAALTFIPASAAFAMAQEDPIDATTAQEDPNDIEAIDNPLDDNDSEGFDDWGLVGLVGLLGLAGLRPTTDRRVETERLVTR